MKTYLVVSDTNYGTVVHVINARNEAEVREIADGQDCVWEGYELIELDTETPGVVVEAGGTGA